MKSMIVNLINQVKDEFSPESLEGKTVHWVNKYGPLYTNVPDAIIAGCEYDIGITIQHPNGDKLSCINKKDFDTDMAISDVSYNKLFWFIIRMLQKGYYDTQKKNNYAFNRTDGRYPKIAPMATCAFM